ncbi:MAG: hypothetical protein JWQ35_1176 [Bacteriovoracaceae bacterium]|nr:hypothetical protein [Bacteriovoracaceae bacterium]
MGVKGVRVVLCSFTILISLSPVISWAQEKDKWVESFSRDEERARVLGLMTNYPVPDLEIIESEKASPQQKEFLNHFQKYIWPQLRELPELTRLWWDPPGGRIEIYNNAINRVLYNSDAEEEEWKKWQKEMDGRYRKVLSSPEWQGDVKKWAELSKDLKGELPELARQMHSDLEINEFTPNEVPLFAELADISDKIQSIVKKSKFHPTLDRTAELSINILKNFYNGEVSFDSGWRQTEALRYQGSVALGRDVAKQGEALFQRSAEIRTELAHRKGYRTWAEYVLATYARHHFEGLKTVSDWQRFLQKTLDDTQEATRIFLEKRIGEFGGSLEKARPSQLAFFNLPAGVLVKDYFPKEEIEKSWVKAMKESGFSSDLIDTIHRDMYSRPKKYNHAYLSYNVPARPKVIRVSATELRAELPDPKNKSEWIPMGLDIVESMRTDGIAGTRTMLHEGGHGLEHGSAGPGDAWGNGNSNAYSETHSKMMELFLQDPEFLVHIGKNREGQSLEKSVAERFVMETQVNKLLSLRQLSSNSLMDLELWNFEFGPEKERFVDRAKRLYGVASENITQIKSPPIDGIDPRYAFFSTDHFYSGRCRYWGYAGAEIAAEMIMNSLLDHLEKTTGRRTVARQPGIANYLIKGIFEDGGKVPFPLSIEKLTQKAYSPDMIVKKAVKAAQKYSSCPEDLAKLILPTP